MLRALNEMAFSRLLDDDIAYITVACNNSTQRRQLLDLLNKYLDAKGRRTTLPDDEIFALGCELKELWPTASHDELRDSVRSGVAKAVADIFLSGFGSVGAVRPTLPTRSEYRKVLASLASGQIQRSITDVQELVERYFAYVEATGDTQIAVVSTSKLCSALLRRPTAAARYGSSHAAQDIVRRLLRWEPWNPYLWSLWAESYLAEGAFDAAESVYWEGIRRLSNAEALRNQLQQLLRRVKGREPEALLLARENEAMFPGREIFANQLANTLIATEEASARIEGIEILIGLTSKNPGNYVNINSLGSGLTALAKSGTIDVDFVRRVAARLPGDQVLLGKVGKVLRMQSDGAPLAEAFFHASISRLDKSVGLRNQYAGVLAQKGTPEARSEAIRLLRENVDSSTDKYARNELAHLLVASGDPDERMEAISLLEATIGDAETDNKESREALRRIKTGAPLEDKLLEERANGKETDIEPEYLKTVYGATRHPPSAELVSLARVRRLHFRFENGSADAKEAAAIELQEILKEDPTFAYAQLLAVRQGVWIKDSRMLPQFPAAFELALQNEELAALEMLWEQYPAFEALIFVARAMFGDTDSLPLVQSLIAGGEAAPGGLENMLTTRLRPLFMATEGREQLVNALHKQKGNVIAILRDVTEAAIGGGNWRVAA